MNFDAARVLVVVESEGTARAWGASLRPGDRVIHTGGHVLQLAAGPVSLARWPPPRVAVPGRGATLQRLRRIAREVDAVAIATDADREGERIAADVVEAIRPGTPFGRIVLPAPSTSALEAALRGVRPIAQSRSDAALVRAVFDAALAQRLRPRFGADTLGRVQAAALGALVAAVASEEVATYVVRLQVAGLPAFRIGANGAPETFDGPAAAALAAAAPRSLLLLSMERASPPPPPPLTTAALVGRAARELGMTVESVLERLVELARGVRVDGRVVSLITYPRTDAAAANGGAGHGALEPLPGAPDPAALRGQLDEGARRIYARVYEAAAARAEPQPFVVLTLAGGADRFRAAGRLAPERVEGLLPGRSLRATHAEAATVGPAATEGALVETLAALGVGRPSTLAAAVGSLHRRGLASRRRGELALTPRGAALHRRLSREAPDLLGAQLTAVLEAALAEVEAGRISPRAALSGPLAAAMPAVCLPHTRSDHAVRCDRCDRPVPSTRPAAIPGLAGSRRFSCWNCVHLA